MFYNFNPAFDFVFKIIMDKNLMDFFLSYQVLTVWMPIRTLLICVIFFNHILRNKSICNYYNS